MGVLEGQVAIVTGAARGHAKSGALQFPRDGAAVSNCDVVPETVQEDEVACAIRKAGSKVRCSQIDVSKEEQITHLVQETIKAFGTVDILTHELGSQPGFCFLCCKAALPEMIKKRFGKIINLSSGTGKQPFSHRAPYTTSKTGIIRFTRTLVADVERYP